MNINSCYFTSCVYFSISAKKYISPYTHLKKLRCVTLAVALSLL